MYNFVLKDSFPIIRSQSNRVTGLVSLSPIHVAVCNKSFEFVCSRGANLSCGQDIHSVSWGTLYIHDTDTKTQTQDNNLWLDDMSKGVALCKTLYGINVNNLKRAFGKHLHYNNNRNIRLL